MRLLDIDSLPSSVLLTLLLKVSVSYPRTVSYSLICHLSSVWLFQSRSKCLFLQDIGAGISRCSGSILGRARKCFCCRAVSPDVLWSPPDLILLFRRPFPGLEAGHSHPHLMLWSRMRELYLYTAYSLNEFSSETSLSIRTISDSSTGTHIILRITGRPCGLPSWGLSTGILLMCCTSIHLILSDSSVLSCLIPLSYPPWFVILSPLIPSSHPLWFLLLIVFNSSILSALIPSSYPL
jgi:hypothetical protein